MRIPRLRGALVGIILLVFLFSSCLHIPPSPPISTPSAPPIQSPPSSPSAPLTSLPSVADVVEKVAPAVVYISAETVVRTFFFHESIQTKTGSGVIMRPDGYIITNERMETSIPGIFACGDVRTQLVRQITNAVGDATTAAVAAEKYIEALEDKHAARA